MEKLTLLVILRHAHIAIGKGMANYLAELQVYLFLLHLVVKEILCELLDLRLKLLDILGISLVL